MSHYYQYDPSLKSNKKLVTYTFKGELVKFNSDLGVFSKDRVDFGTNVLLNALDENILESTKEVLDVGCGYGVVGLSIAKRFPNTSVTMIDINDRCVDLTKENIKLNNIKNAKVLLSNLYLNIDTTFDLIISNPPIRAGKEVVSNVIKDGYNRLNIGGKIIVVIQKKQGAPSLSRLMQDVFGNVDCISKEKGYFVLESERKN